MCFEGTGEACDLSLAAAGVNGGVGLRRVAALYAGCCEQGVGAIRGRFYVGRDRNPCAGIPAADLTDPQRPHFARKRAFPGRQGRKAKTKALV